MPKINTQTLAQHREWRRNQLIQAATAIALESGSGAISVSAVAEKAGLSRTSVYEYFASSQELVTDLILDELNNFATTLQNAITTPDNPEATISQWLRAALCYIADGRHLLAKALSATAPTKDRAAEIGNAHRLLLSPLQKSLESMGIADVRQAMALIQSLTDVATKRIESGANPEVEISTTITFTVAGLKSLT